MANHTPQTIKGRLGRLSFKTGVAILASAVICYIISFGQILLPLSTTAKWVLWAVFFGMAKTLQYSAIAILGTAGIKKLRAFRQKRHAARSKLKSKEMKDERGKDCREQTVDSQAKG